MSEKESERILHKLGRSSMNADWDAIIKFHGAGGKIASVVTYEAFDLQSILGGAGTMHQLPNAKKILKVGCLKSTGIVSSIVPSAAFVN
eukprot:scaffold185917_cov28-Attheya_sp.AAC.1